MFGRGDQLVAPTQSRLEVHHPRAHALEGFVSPVLDDGRFIFEGVEEGRDRGSVFDVREGAGGEAASLCVLMGQGFDEGRHGRFADPFERVGSGAGEKTTGVGEAGDERRDGFRLVPSPQPVDGTSPNFGVGLPQRGE